MKVYADEKSAAAAVKEDTPPLSPRNRRAPTAGAKGALTRSYSIKQLLRKMGSKVGLLVPIAPLLQFLIVNRNEIDCCIFAGR